MLLVCNKQVTGDLGLRPLKRVNASSTPIRVSIPSGCFWCYAASDPVPGWAWRSAQSSSSRIKPSLHYRHHQLATGVVEAAARKAAGVGRRYALDVVQQPFVHAEGAMEPHGVIEAGEGQLAIGKTKPLRHQQRRDQVVARDVGEDRAVEIRIVTQLARGAHAHPAQWRCTGGRIGEIRIDRSQLERRRDARDALDFSWRGVEVEVVEGDPPAPALPAVANRACRSDTQCSLQPSEMMPRG